MNVPLSFTSPNQFTAADVGEPAPNCGGGSPYIDPNTSEWACTPAPPAPPSNPGSITMFLLAAAVAGYLYWTYGTKTQKTLGALLS